MQNAFLFAYLPKNPYLCAQEGANRSYIKVMTTSIIEPIKAYFRTQPIKKAWVFGSYSRGEERQDSDVDILVQYDRTNQRVGLFTIIRIKQQLEQIVGREVDLVEDGTLMPFAVESANHDKILIYEKA